MKYFKNIKRTKTVSVLISALILVLCFSPITGFADEEALSRGEAAEMIITAAAEYNKDITEENVLKGYEDGQLSREKPVNRIESYLMIARAFGTLEAPKGNNLRTGVFEAVFADVPDWAKSELKNLEDSGLLTGKSQNLLGVFDTISKEELLKVLSRLYAYVGTNEKDDFYSKVNKAWLETSDIPVGRLERNVFGDLTDANRENIKKIIDEAGKAEAKEGAREQKIADFYSTALDTKAANEKGIEPIQKYINLIDNAKNIAELVEADAVLDRETGLSILIPWGVSENPKDSTKNMMHYFGGIVTLDKAAYDQEDDKTVSALKTMIARYLVLAGEDIVTAEKHAEAVYLLEKDLAAYDLSAQEMSNVEKTYNPYSKEEFVKLFNGFDMGKALENLGIDNISTVNLYKKNLTLRAAELMNNSNLEVWKAAMKYGLLSQSAMLLSQEAENISLDFRKEYYGISGNLPREEQALNLTAVYLSTPIEQIYAKEYFSESAKRDVKKMTERVIKVYKDRIDENEWLSETTKKMALKKLDSITVKIGYPDVWPEYIDNAEIKSVENGGNLFENATAPMAIKNVHIKENIEGKADKKQWQMNIYDVNAYYNPSNNEIVFPAGILQKPFYDEKASEESNLGGIGMVIAHEITHAFDNNGAKYDENGNANNWWTAYDFAELEERCNQVEVLYDNVEIAPGIENDGQLTISENVADLGGLSCALEVASKMKNPNYEEFFENFAVVFRATKPRTTLEYYSRTDVHSNGKIRVNQAVKNFDEFYEIYHISEGDGMYLAPDDRITIW